MRCSWVKSHEKNIDGIDYTWSGHWRRQWGGLPTLRDKDIWVYFDLDENGRGSDYFLDPNAKCPECRQPVYFLRHRENGGCAWFDSIPPDTGWEKHPCMNPDDYSRASARHDCEEDRQQRQRHNDRLQEKLNSVASRHSKDMFASLCLERKHCKICDADEYVFELTDGTLRKFQSVGIAWALADCISTQVSAPQKADGYAYLADHIANGGKWKPKTPKPRPDDDNPTWKFEWLSDRGIARRYFTNPFQTSDEKWMGVIPCSRLAAKIQGSSAFHYLCSALHPYTQIIIETGRSTALEMTDLVFVRIPNAAAGIELSYLCLDTGKGKIMKKMKVVAWNQTEPPQWYAWGRFPSKADAMRRLDQEALISTNASSKEDAI